LGQIWFRSADLVEQVLDDRKYRGYPFRDCAPDDGVVDDGVTVREDIAQADDPGDVGNALRDFGVRPCAACSVPRR